jgi:hypothetical protein
VKGGAEPIFWQNGCDRESSCDEKKYQLNQYINRHSFRRIIIHLALRGRFPLKVAIGSRVNAQFTDLRDSGLGNEG